MALFGHRIVRAATITAAIALSSGCGDGPDVATLEVSPRGWDTLAVSLRFENRDVFGRLSPAIPRSVSYSVFSSAYDTLYAGPDSVIAVPDERLGDAEPILVEACGEFGADRVCEQHTVFASPKRVWSGLDVDYPTDLEYSRGDYRARPVVERRVFGGNDWEVLPHAPVPPMTAHVRVAGAADEGIRIPIRAVGGRFDLRSGEGYRDFHFNLRSAFRDSGRAEVVFQVVAGVEGRETPAGSARIALVDRSEEELLDGLQDLVREAGGRIVTILQGFLGAGRTYIFIDAWTYDSGERRYEAELVFWSGRSGRDDWAEMTGRLEASEDGERVVFRLGGASSDLARRWSERIRSDSLSLGPLRLPSRRSSDGLRGW